MRVTRHRVLAKFGLMHMIGTNLSVWLNVLVQETKHEILTFYNPADNSIGVNKHPNQFSREFCSFVKNSFYECKKKKIEKPQHFQRYLVVHFFINTNL